MTEDDKMFERVEEMIAQLERGQSAPLYGGLDRRTLIRLLELARAAATVERT